jgi:integrase/recombinase XerD
MTAIAATVQAFFTEYLITQHQVSGHTLAAYRDVVRMLLSFTANAPGSPATGLISPIWTR